MAFGVYDFVGPRAVPVEDDWSWLYTWTAGPTVASAVPVNLTGYTAVFELWADPYERTLLHSTPCVLGGVAATVLSAVGSPTLRAQPRGLLYYTQVFTDPLGVHRTLMRGQYQTV
jgi:hypothetical protein